jgi:hypothetical protein
LAPSFSAGFGIVPNSTDFFWPQMKNIDVNELRARLQRLDNLTLLSFGRSAQFMCSPQANQGRAASPGCLIQLREARDEWRRRNRNAVTVDSF